MSGSYIIRAPRPDDPWERLPVALLRDKRLSFRARGLAVRLLSNKDGYRMPMTMLAAEAVSEERMPTSPREGRDALYKALAELRWVGYVVQEHEQDERGRWITKTYIHDMPQPQPKSSKIPKKRKKKPKTDKPDPA